MTNKKNGSTPAERAADSQPSLQDYSSEDMWDLNRKITFGGEQYDNRIENLNQKVVADAQAQAVFWQNIQERQLSLKLASQELMERQQNFWHTMRERQDHHNVDMARSRNGVQNDNEIAMKHNIMAARTVEPSREEVSQDSVRAVVDRAMVDRTQTGAANVSELAAARQVTDVNVLNTLSEVVGIMNTAQASNQALANQVAELTGVVKALMER